MYMRAGNAIKYSCVMSLSRDSCDDHGTKYSEIFVMSRPGTDTTNIVTLSKSLEALLLLLSLLSFCLELSSPSKRQNRRITTSCCCVVIVLCAVRDVSYCEIPSGGSGFQIPDWSH